MRAPRGGIGFLLLTSLAGVLLASPATASAASTGGYPYASMPCEHSPYAVSGGANYCANYDWGPKHTQAYDDPSEISPYGYAYRNCTDFVAWQLASLGVPASAYKGHGNGAGWASVSGLTTNTTPAVGAVAVSTSGTFGHVAFIAGVSGSEITIDEYNYGENGTYDVRTGTLADLGFNKVTHFEKDEKATVAGTSSVADSPTADGHIQLFTVVGGSLQETWYSPSNGQVGGVSAPVGAPSSLVGSPSLVQRPDQSVIDAFVRATNGVVYETWYNWGNGAWGGWIGLPGGSIAGDPEATYTSDGHDQVFSVLSNGLIAQTWFDPSTGKVGGVIEV